MYDNVIAACARWETDYIAEWLIFHRSIGFDHVFLYCNDEDPRELYEAVLPFTQGDKPFVTFRHFGILGQQGQMYTHFLRNFKHLSRNYIFLDVDEFILLRNDNTIREFISRFPGGVGAIHLFSVNAGHNGHATRPSGSAIRNYTRRSEMPAPFTKCLVRSDEVDDNKIASAVGSGFWHHADCILKDGMFTLDSRGVSMRGYYLNIESNFPERLADPTFAKGVLDTGFIYHIGIKSLADFARRVERGAAGDFFVQEAWTEYHQRGPDFLEEFLRPSNVVEELRLVEVADATLARAFDHQIAAPPIGTNIALGKPATQSSISPWSRFQDLAQDAAGAVSGKPRGLWSHHTDHEEAPWWQVDLQEPTAIHEVRVFNRVDAVRSRLRDFTVLGSHDGEGWTFLHAKDDGAEFGGVDGQMHIWTPQNPVVARYIRIVRIGAGVLDLDQVEVY